MLSRIFSILLIFFKLRPVNKSLKRYFDTTPTALDKYDVNLDYCVTSIRQFQSVQVHKNGN